MGCPKFEDLVEGHKGVEAHLSICPECRAWREALAEVDTALTAGLSDFCVPPHFKARITAGLRPVPIAPALLDLAGAMGAVAVLLILIFRFVPDLEADLNTLLAIAGFSLLASLALAYRSLAKA